MTKILIVDDDQDARQLAGVALSNLDPAITVHYAANGAEALCRIFECWLTEPFDAILLDCAMPDLDGITVGRIIRLAEMPSPHKQIALGFCTAYGKVVNHATCELASLNPTLLLTKPVDYPRLSEMLRNWLATSPQSDQPTIEVKL